MKPSEIEISQIVAATTFLAALVINISVTLTDPFIMMSDEAVAQTTSTTTTSGGECVTNVTPSLTPPEINTNPTTVKVALVIVILMNVVLVIRVLRAPQFTPQIV